MPLTLLLSCYTSKIFSWCAVIQQIKMMSPSVKKYCNANVYRYGVTSLAAGCIVNNAIVHTLKFVLNCTRQGIFTLLYKCLLYIYIPGFIHITKANFKSALENLD